MASTLFIPADCCNDCDECDSTVTIIDECGCTGMFVKDTLAQMRAIPTLSTNLSVQLNGMDAAGDGFGGVYRWIDDGIGADNPLQTIRPDDFSIARGGVWEKLI